MSFYFPPDPEKIIKAAESLAESAILEKDFLLIGHRLGNFRHYPLNVNKKRYLKDFINTSELMIKSFTEYGLNALELDLRLGPDGMAYVVHDRIKKNIGRECLSWLSENSFEKLLIRFIENGFSNDKKLFVELKLSPKIFHPKKQGFFPDAVSSSERRLIEEIFSVMKRVSSVYPDRREEIRRSVGFISFSLAALHTAYAVSEEIHEYHLITTTDHFLKKNLSRALFYIPLNTEEKTKITYSEWLTGIWFDPKYIADPVQTFLEINEQRKNRLQFYVSSYGMDFSKISGRFFSERGEKLPVKGIFFDISDEQQMRPQNSKNS